MEINMRQATVLGIAVILVLVVTEFFGAVRAEADPGIGPVEDCAMLNQLGSEPVCGLSDGSTDPAPQPQSTEGTGYIVLSAHGVVRSSTLPHCANDEGQPVSGPAVPALGDPVCTWNVGRRIDGNGDGLAYLRYSATDPANGDPFVVYVWERSPIRNGWHWERGLRPLSWCVEKWVGNRHVIRCPNGLRAVG